MSAHSMVVGRSALVVMATCTNRLQVAGCYADWTLSGHAPQDVWAW